MNITVSQQNNTIKYRDKVGEKQNAMAFLANNTGITREHFPPIPKVQRSRSASRKSIPVQPTATAKKRPMKISYAAAVTRSTAKPELMRNLNLMGSSDTIQNSPGYFKRRQKGKTNLTITFKDEECAKRTDELFAANYRNTIKVNNVVPVKPMAKITRIFTNLEDDENIFRCEQPLFEIIRTYEVETSL